MISLLIKDSFNFFQPLKKVSTYHPTMKISDHYFHINPNLFLPSHTYFHILTQFDWRSIVEEIMKINVKFWYLI